jgi:Ran GTPase-activating protein (RanGAP) involved in mRNA processing and transport
MKLDISKNQNLSLKSYKDLTTHLIKVKSKISHLNFEGNEFGDEVCAELCRCFEEIRSVNVLNMSKCNITDYGAQYISELLSEPGIQIRVLLLHWNRIRGKGATQLAKAVKVNNSLQVLDASFNAFGSCPLRKKKVQKRQNKEVERSNSKTPRGLEK